MENARAFDVGELDSRTHEKASGTTVRDPSYCQNSSSDRKGQQLIGNAKVTAQVAQFKAIDAATSTFRDMYAALPGDITNATNSGQLRSGTL